MAATPHDEDPLLSDAVWARMLKAYDDAWEVYAPADFDHLEATTRFLQMAPELMRVAGPGSDVEVWPTLVGAAFHGLVQLDPAATADGASASVRASNFGNLITIYGAAEAVRPPVFSELRRLFEHHGYRYAPPAALLRPYFGYHAGKIAAREWVDRFFGYP